MTTTVRDGKGDSLISFCDTYILIDIETTGLSPIHDEIIEIAAIKVENNIIIDEFQSFVKPMYAIPEYITQITGITNDMVANAPDILEVIDNFDKFVSKDSLIVGHNVNFDINFLYDNYLRILQKPFRNDYIDTLRISRKCISDIENHKLQSLSNYFNLPYENAHRALEDCKITKKVFDCLKKNFADKENSLVLFNGTPKKSTNTTIALPENYCVLDLETTGYSTESDYVIEFAVLRIRNNKIVDTFTSLCGGDFKLKNHIVKKTGITNDMIADKPTFDSFAPDIIRFIGDDFIIGHNIPFDIGFLKKYCDFENQSIDTLRMSRKLNPEMLHHHLSDVADHYSISFENSHRSVLDCELTKLCYDSLKQDAINKYGSEAEFANSFVRINRTHHYFPMVKATDISTENTVFDETHPLFDKLCVFTGKLNRMTRTEAMQSVVDFGGKVGDTVTLKTNYLILGNNDYCKFIKGNKSTKQKKAEEYKIKGYDIEIIPEEVFYDMLEVMEEV